MKKKFLAFLLTLCFIVPSALMFSACSNTEDCIDNKYKITVIQSINGVISPDFIADSNTIELTEGSSYTFYIDANEGYRISCLLIDGKVVPASSTYTFLNIKDNHTISASFEVKEEIEEVKLEAIKINYRMVKNDLSVTISSLKISQDYSENNGYDFVYGSDSLDIINDISRNVGSLNGKVRSYKFEEIDIANNVKFFKNTAKIDLYCKNGLNSGSTGFGEINESVTLSVYDLEIIESDKFVTLFSYTINNSSNNFIASIELIFSAV